MRDTAPSRELLLKLAESYGVATEYWAYSGVLTPVSDATLTKVLAAMNVDASTAQSAARALADAQLRPWRTILPECTVMRAAHDYVIHVHVPDGSEVHVTARLEDGSEVSLPQVDDFTPPRDVDGLQIGQASFDIPPHLPLGYHELHAVGTRPNDNGAFEDTAPLIVVPDRIGVPSDRKLHAWGVMAQLYSVRSRDSWGIGDTADLKGLCSTFGAMGGDFVLINPLHAAEPVGHMTPSPYLPVTRRFFNPIYIRPEDIREVAYMPPEQRALVAWAGEEPKAASLRNGIIDRDGCWQKKREALEVIFRVKRSAAREREFLGFRRAEGRGLEDFAFWCALREKYGEHFPAAVARPDTPQAAQERADLVDRIDFYAWMQWIMDQQLAEAQRGALSSGMAFGICHDLAVGVHAHGSDTWSNPEVFAAGVTVGAPPDMYNQLGQNWSQPPWRPDALRRSAYAPLRDMAKTVLRHAGALRIDHVMGLFRLWWIPEGASPSEGTYVHFDHEAMVGVLMLEAVRAGAVVIGEDLGNVESWVPEYLAARGILGTSVLWFEQDGHGNFKRPEQFRKNSLVTVDTHDLPPLAGYLAGEHVELRYRLGMLTEPVEKVRAAAREEKQRMMERLREYGLIGEDPSEREIVEAMYRYIAKIPAELLAVALVDAVGERRSQNQPGTNNEYPNWRLPLADSENNVVLLEDLDDNPRLISLVHVFTEEIACTR
ncbi:MAG: 4-alpha-glucanotransferase [Ancrocorticia sp.]|nr:4-alpha-glucanotransferase [Ancrocorticia sp.]MCI2001716.1 4-alpha-glucanotransferase [Ancrocorticia sp.]